MQTQRCKHSDSQIDLAVLSHGSQRSLLRGVAGADAGAIRSIDFLYISPVQSIRLTQTESQRPDGGLIRQPRGACAPADAGVERSPRAAQDLA